MYCPQCGQKMDENTIFCSNCGVQIKQRKVVNYNSSVVRQQNQEIPNKKIKLIKKGIGGWLIIFPILLIIKLYISIDILINTYYLLFFNDTNITATFDKGSSIVIFFIVDFS